MFEQHYTVGGVWAYTPHAEDTDWWVSPMYENLETNIPHTLMNYTDLNFPAEASLFPSHEIVRRYLDAYAEPLADIITLSTKVVSVRKVETEGRNVWELQSRQLGTDELSTSYWDAIVVANGHYNEAFIPSITGLDAWVDARPGMVSHSKHYRRPEDFEGKKVIVVGNSASGIDISAQISTTAKLPVIVSEKERPKPESAIGEATAAWKKMMPEMVECIPDGRSLRFADATVETNVDAVVFCTGYKYKFPFLKDLPSPVVTDGACVHSLYKHVFYIDDPTLAFLGIPQRIVPFPFAEGQAAWASRVWAGRLSLPPTLEMRAWEAALEEVKGRNTAALHTMAPTEDVDYINEMHGLCLEAATDEILDNQGLGKLPPFWDEEKRWLRGQMPFVKAASRSLGSQRHKVRDLQALGFVFPSGLA